MIYAPRGWSGRSTADGMVLFPPGGPDAGHLIYRERVRPLVPVNDIFRQLLAAPDHGDADVDLAMLRSRLVVTSEGEYAAVAMVRNRAGAVQHDLGVVLLDDFYALLHGVTRDASCFAAHHAAFLELVHNDLHHLGCRRRRYLYEAPRDWQGRPRGFETDYFPLDYPAQALMLTVMPAVPRAPDADSRKYVEAILQQQRQNSAVDYIGQTSVAKTPHLAGSELFWTVRIDERWLGRRVVALEDERYLYPILLEGEGDLEAARATFVAVVDSIEPLPEAGRPAAPQTASELRMWEG